MYLLPIAVDWPLTKLMVSLRPSNKGPWIVWDLKWILRFVISLFFTHRNLRKTNQQPILMSLCISLMLLLIVFIAGAGQTENLIGCRIVALLLHYLTLSSIMWMGVEGYNMYMSFVQVMATYQSKFMLKASLVAWGLPVLIVAITVSVATNYYGREDV